MFKTLILLAGVAILGAAVVSYLPAAPRSPITLRTKPNPLHPYLATNSEPLLEFTAKVDKVKIKKITINKGKCKFSSKNRLPKKLVLGDVLSGIAYCRVEAVVVETADQGTWTFKL